jgi:phosphoribosylaminoimidazole-succinocarboxamide synthase
MPVYETNLPFPLLSRGKVRDIYDTPEGILLVSTDRLSAFDVVFPDPISQKGRVLNQLSAYWFEETTSIVDNHLISAEPVEQLGLAGSHPELRGRCTLCRRAKPLPVECVVRGYLEGSAWKDYQESQSVCGIKLPSGLSRRAKLPHPIFTPTTKATSGHDLPITFEEVVELVGVETAEAIRHKSIELYAFAHERLLTMGILISDTKFEFGISEEGKLMLIDEAMTPDSSRFWEAEGYTSGGNSRSLDKQYVRDFVEKIGWNKTPPAPHLPEDVRNNTTQLYVEIYGRITGRSLEGMDQE